MSQLIVQIKTGKVEGFEENGMYKWRGIPYAVPPVGERRFKRAVPAESWEGIRSCRNWGKRPYQFASPLLYFTIGDSRNESSEDCLNLNVWAPKDAEKAPVLVWFYGGFNHMGDSSLPQFQMDHFAEKGIVCVTVNYRVGPLGYYDFSRLDSSFDSNCAVSDLTLAMHWVQENIAAFGGDPDHVTIGGESAGGTCVYSLLSAPAARGTFQQAIAMSGLASNLTSYRTHELNNQVFLDTIGIVPEEVGQLRKMPAECMIPGGVEIYARASLDHHPGIICTGPVLDDLIPQYPWRALESGNAKDVKCILGTTKDDGSVFYKSGKAATQSWEKTEQMFREGGCPEKLESIRKLYAGMEEPEAMMALATDRLFWVDSIKCSLAQSKQNTVYSYRYDYVLPENQKLGIGAAHASDTPVALNTYVRKNDVEMSSGEQKMRKELHGAFVQFVKTGNPNGNLPVYWETYNEEKQATYLFNEESSLICHPKQEVYEVWKDVSLYQ